MVESREAPLFRVGVQVSILFGKEEQTTNLLTE